MVMTTTALQRNRRRAVRGVSSRAVKRPRSDSRDSAKSFAPPTETARVIRGLEPRSASRCNGGKPASIGFDRSFAPRQTAVKEMRDALSECLKVNAIEDSASGRILLCAEEALTNAIEHSGEGESPIAVSVRVNDENLSVEVSDLGCGFDPTALDLESPPDPLSERGRGLFLIRHLMDDVEIVSNTHGTTARMTLHLQAAVSAKLQ